MFKEKIKRIVLRSAKKIAGIPVNDGFTIDNYKKYKRLRQGPKKYKEKYNADQIVEIMKDLGMKKGSNVFIHSSWNEFYNFQGNQKELIGKIISVIGEEGTLIMPAYPLLRPNKIFDVRKTVTKAGLLAETFRKYPGVKRSINVRHSVCALGPKADFLLKEHHLGLNCWDEKSPYYKLSEINALIFSLGLGTSFVGTIVHCVEGVLFKELPYFKDMFTKDTVTYKYIDYDGIEKEYSCFEQNVTMKEGPFRAKRYKKKYLNIKRRKLSNLDITMIEANKAIPTMINNGRKGELLFSTPSKRGYSFDNN